MGQTITKIVIYLLDSRKPPTRWKHIHHAKNLYFKERRPDPSVRGVTYISTCTGINFHPIAKSFDMRAYLSVIKPPIFLFDHWMLESRNFGHFKKKFDRFWAVGVSKLVNFFNKKITNFETSTAQNLSNFF